MRGNRKTGESRRTRIGRNSWAGKQETTIWREQEDKDRQEQLCSYTLTTTRRENENKSGTRNS